MLRKLAQRRKKEKYVREQTRLKDFAGLTSEISIGYMTPSVLHIK